MERPEDPVREGYTFVGWYPAGDFGNPYNFDKPVEFSFTLYAVWKAQLPSPPTGDGNGWMMIMMISSALCAWYLSDKVRKAKI